LLAAAITTLNPSGLLLELEELLELEDEFDELLLELDEPLLDELPLELDELLDPDELLPELDEPVLELDELLPLELDE